MPAEACALAHRSSVARRLGALLGWFVWLLSCARTHDTRLLLSAGCGTWALWAFGAQSNVEMKGGSSHSSDRREHIDTAILRLGVLLDSPPAAVLFASALEHVHVLHIPELLHPV